jgi:hypothetical protein
VIKGYARVSTDGQDFATQHELLKEAGAPCFIVRDRNGQALAFVYFEHEPCRRVAALGKLRCARSFMGAASVFNVLSLPAHPRPHLVWLFSGADQNILKSFR